MCIFVPYREQIFIDFIVPDMVQYEGVIQLISYQKLFDLMKQKGIKQIDLRKKGVHPRTFSKLANGELIRSDTIDQLCALLDCQPGDIMEYIPDSKEQ